MKTGKKSIRDGIKDSAKFVKITGMFEVGGNKGNRISNFG